MAPKKDIIGIIGYGKVGASLSSAFYLLGFQVFVYSDITGKKLIPNAFFLSSLQELLQKTKIIFICIPDKAIEDVISDIISTCVPLKNKIFYHTSGSKTSQILHPVKNFGGQVASFHPLQTFPKPEHSIKIWKNIFCVVEGDVVAIRKAKFFCKQLQCSSLVLPVQSKVLYHTAAVMASNFLVLLIHMSQQVAAYASIDNKQYFKLFLPLIQKTLLNIARSNCQEALSGPLVRGDYEVLSSHLKEIKQKNALIAEAYELFIEYYSKEFKKSP